MIVGGYVRMAIFQVRKDVSFISKYIFFSRSKSLKGILNVASLPFGSNIDLLTER